MTMTPAEQEALYARVMELDSNRISKGTWFAVPEKAHHLTMVHSVCTSQYEPIADHMTLPDALFAAEAPAMVALLRAQHDELQHLRRGKELSIKAENAIQQALGQALGYPWFKDDQKNFPGATEADGVCAGEHVAETMAVEAADRIRAQHEQLQAMRDNRVSPDDFDDIWHLWSFHDLKCWPEFFEHIESGRKAFEIRKNDRNFNVGDFLRLHEFDPKNNSYSGRVCFRQIGYMTDFEQKPGFVVIGFLPTIRRGGGGD